MMSVKKMVDLYVRYGCAEETWNMMYEMKNHGLISWDNWSKFFDTCHGWTCEGNIIIDSEGNVIYHTDESGYWQKVA